MLLATGAGELSRVRGILGDKSIIYCLNAYWHEGAVEMNDDEVRVLKMLKNRIFTPLQEIVDKVFGGDHQKAEPVLRELARTNMIRCVSNKCVSLTAAGKMNIPRIKRRQWS